MNSVQVTLIDGHVDIISSFDGQVSLLRGQVGNRIPFMFLMKRIHGPNHAGVIHSCLMDVDSDGDLDFCGSNNTSFGSSVPMIPSLIALEVPDD